MVDFADNCLDKVTFGEECANNYLKSNGIDSQKVNKCVNDSFVKDKFGKVIDNRLLREDAEWARTLGVFMLPSITINNITYRGDKNGYDIFKAVCAGFQDMPEICKGDAVFD